MSKQEALISQVKHQAELKRFLGRGGLVPLYKNIFSEPPYSEKFNDEEVKGYFTQYFERGCVFVAKIKAELVGFSVMLPLREVPDVRVLIEGRSEFNIDTSQYLAELGVGNEYRGLGYGRRLAQACLANTDQGQSVFLLTTETNNPALSLYGSLGFSIVKGVQHEVERERIDGSIQKDTRVLLHFPKN